MRSYADSAPAEARVAILAALALVTALGTTLATPREAGAWALHYLVTDRALEHPSMKDLDERVAVEPLDSFLAAEKVAVAKLFDDFHAWLGARGSKRFKAQKFDVTKPVTAELIRVARLNPATRIHLVHRTLPGRAAEGEILDLKALAPDADLKAPFFAQAEDRTGQSMPARAVVATFSDEPDWQMDFKLWGIEEYGYGKMPYGGEKGEANKAAFHMLFRHENIVVRTFAGEILEGMVLDRIELFTRLSKLAFATGHKYWGFRFAAWAIHYLQDIGQPYHAKAVPYGDWLYYLKFIVSFDKAKIKKETSTLVKNRHFGYEEFVAYGLQQSYVEDRDLYKRLAGYLSEGDGAFAGVTTPEALLHTVGDFSAGHAAGIDAAVAKVYGHRKSADPTYDIETDKAHNVKETIDALEPQAVAVILEETRADFANVGRATRTLLELVGRRTLK